METHVLLAFQPPWWLQEPAWLHELARQVRVFIFQHQTLGLYLVIFLEEIGIPLPAPGDIAITYGGAQPALRQALRPALRADPWDYGREDGSGRGPFQAVRALGDHRGEARSRLPDRTFGDLGNTSCPLPRFHTVCSRFGDNLGSDLPRAGKAAWAEGARPVFVLPGATNPVDPAWFGAVSRRVFGI